jgi:hypothetical protein
MSVARSYPAFSFGKMTLSLIEGVLRSKLSKQAASELKLSQRRL